MQEYKYANEGYALTYTTVAALNTELGWQDLLAVALSNVVEALGASVDSCHVLTDEVQCTFLQRMLQACGTHHKYPILGYEAWVHDGVALVQCTDYAPMEPVGPPTLVWVTPKWSLEDLVVGGYSF
jgi:GAF domain-containing protein